MTKRLLDLTLILLSTPVWLPLLLGACVALMVGQKGPVFFVQQRPGKNTLPFNLLKLRTMSDERDAAGELLSDAERLTRVGNFIRRTSLDEIPQLLNVIKGDMSLIGPRPLLMSYVPLYSDEHRRRHEVLPGITGLAQVNGRNLLSWDDRFALDVQYVDTRSLLLDIRILFATIGTVLRRRGVSSKTSVTMEPYRGPGS